MTSVQIFSEQRFDRHKDDHDTPQNTDNTRNAKIHRKGSRSSMVQVCGLVQFKRVSGIKQRVNNYG